MADFARFIFPPPPIAIGVVDVSHRPLSTIDSTLCDKRTQRSVRTDQYTTNRWGLVEVHLVFRKMNGAVVTIV